jgi:hypothetical protein
LQYATDPWAQNPGGHETSTSSAGSQNSRVTIWMPNLLTFSVGTTSKTPGFLRLVTHKGALRRARASDLPILRGVSNNSPATDEHSEYSPLGSSAATCVMCSSPSKKSAMFPRQMNLTPRTGWERASHLGGRLQDAETGMESSGFLKSGSGEHLNSNYGRSLIVGLIGRR